MIRAFGGRLDTRALAMLASPAADAKVICHFHVLTHDQQEQVIRRLASAGRHERVIAVTTGWSVEMIRRALATPAALGLGDASGPGGL